MTAHNQLVTHDGNLDGITHPSMNVLIRMYSAFALSLS